MRNQSAPPRRCSKHSRPVHFFGYALVSRSNFRQCPDQTSFATSAPRRKCLQSLQSASTTWHSYASRFMPASLHALWQMNDKPLPIGVCYHRVGRCYWLVAVPALRAAFRGQKGGKTLLAGRGLEKTSPNGFLRKCGISWGGRRDLNPQQARVFQGIFAWPLREGASRGQNFRSET